MNNLNLSPQQTAVFGYGSLLSKASLELTLGHEYQNTPIPGSIRGWRRRWDVMMPNRSFYEVRGLDELVPGNIIYLNVAKVPECLLNGLIYILEAEDLARLDSREWIYRRQTVTDQLINLTFSQGELVVYVGRAEYAVPSGCTVEQAAIRRSYLQIVDRGLEELGNNFRLEYFASTDVPPQQLIINDRKRGQNPSLAGSRESESKSDK